MIRKIVAAVVLGAWAAGTAVADQEPLSPAEASEIADHQRAWAQQLAEHFAAFWLRPPRLGDGWKCGVEIQLLPNGEVVSVRVLAPSGNPGFDNSVIGAVYKSSPVPMPADPRAFVRVLRPTFTPDSLGTGGKP